MDIKQILRHILWLKRVLTCVCIQKKGGVGNSNSWFKVLKLSDSEKKFNFKCILIELPKNFTTLLSRSCFANQMLPTWYTVLYWFQMPLEEDVMDWFFVFWPTLKGKNGLRIKNYLPLCPFEWPCKPVKPIWPITAVLIGKTKCHTDRSITNIGPSLVMGHSLIM